MHELLFHVRNFVNVEFNRSFNDVNIASLTSSNTNVLTEFNIFSIFFHTDSLFTFFDSCNELNDHIVKLTTKIETVTKNYNNIFRFINEFSNNVIAKQNMNFEKSHDEFKNQLQTIITKSIVECIRDLKIENYLKKYLKFRFLIICKILFYQISVNAKNNVRINRKIRCIVSSNT